MYVVAFLNQKGGVGKTTLAVTLAAGLAGKGFNVLLIDTDPQGHAGFSLGVDKAPSFYDLLVRGADMGKVTKLVPPFRYLPKYEVDKAKGRLYIIPSNLETRGIPTQVSDDLIILKILVQLEKTKAIDFVIFDTSPTPSHIHKMLLIASDGVIYPTEVSTLSMDGLAESVKHVKAANRERVNQGLPQIRLLGIVPVRTRKTLEHRGNLKELETVFDTAVVWGAIPTRTVWEECTRERLSIFAYAPYEDATTDARLFINRFMGSLEVKVHS